MPRAFGVPVEMETIRRSIEVIEEPGVDYEFWMTVLPCLRDAAERSRIGPLLGGARTVYLLNCRLGKTRAPTFAKEPPCSPEALQAFRRILEGDVEGCLVRKMGGVERVATSATS